jgi:hypothetical protein
MKKERFEGKTLEEAKRKLAEWQSAHKAAVIKKEYQPVAVKMQTGRFAAKSSGKVTSVYINIDYENSN